MKDYGISVIRHSCLYETEPAHVTDQPKFLNAAIRGVTKHEPHELLNVLKKIEKEMGREENGLRYGPRPLDLDILFYGKHRITSDKLIIPHERIWERPFVLAPLVDLLGTEDIDNDHIVEYWHSLSIHPGGIFQAWERLGGESLLAKDGIQRVIPIGDHLWDFSKKTYVMGILNLTPDSFSDGGKFQSIDSAVSQVRLMISEGVDIIDIGAQSTRPMASRISTQEEIDRLIPVLKFVRGMAEMKGKLISVDTFNSEVALEAIRNGADILNDVSGGKLYERVKEAELSGIPAWRIMIDPGIGFSKGIDHNLDIIMELPKIRGEMGKKSIGLSHAPILIGPSRKRFLGDICGRPEASERDSATVACVTAGILKGANIIRVHNVRDNVDAARLCDAMMKKRLKKDA
ncbi:Pterin-binding domain [Arabidopsis thaliana x Arabidopsis arenosa]|uniref:dihydropteroate synthase n=1 Tax=Arabidopsis thaliana x Arabidopsis arenosa TaxID=1240361 RepID=A0A8T2BKK3_9BRAS|nr:Pterin-binding domain [Arabidopsis thaliana x Arabidopsis arenosa]